MEKVYAPEEAEERKFFSSKEGSLGKTHKIFSQVKKFKDSKESREKER